MGLMTRLQTAFMSAAHRRSFGARRSNLDLVTFTLALLRILAGGLASPRLDESPLRRAVAVRSLIVLNFSEASRTYLFFLPATVELRTVSTELTSAMSASDRHCWCSDKPHNDPIALARRNEAVWLVK
jgi:hypothetical protein